MLTTDCRLHLHDFDLETQREPLFGEMVAFDGFLLDVLPQATSPYFVPLLEAEIPEIKLASVSGEAVGKGVAAHRG